METKSKRFLYLNNFMNCWTYNRAGGMTPYLIAFSLLQPLLVELFAGIQFPRAPHLTGKDFPKTPFPQYTKIHEPVISHGLHLQPLPLQKPLQVHTLQEKRVGHFLEEVHHTVHGLVEKVVRSLLVLLFDLRDAIFWQKGAVILGIRLHITRYDLARFVDSIFILGIVVLLDVFPQTAGAFVLVVGLQELLEETFADGLLHTDRLEAQV